MTLRTRAPVSEFLSVERLEFFPTGFAEVATNVDALRVDQIFAHEWTTAGILEVAKGFRRLKAYKHLPALRAALAAHQSKCVSKRVEDNADVA
jgi:hypothetical protein